MRIISSYIPQTALHPTVLLLLWQLVHCTACGCCWPLVHGIARCMFAQVMAEQGLLLGLHLKHVGTESVGCMQPWHVLGTASSPEWQHTCKCINDLEIHWFRYVCLCSSVCSHSRACCSSTHRPHVCSCEERALQPTSPLTFMPPFQQACGDPS